MSDVLTAAQRSLCMSKNRGKNTKLEIQLRHACFAAGLRHRLHSKLPGRPDFVYPSAGVVVFVDGCFWHGCPEHYIAPAQRADFWKEKRRRNAERDSEVNRQLEELGWTVLRVWEHQIRKSMPSVVEQIRNAVLDAKAGRAKDKGAKTSGESCP
ncbi:MAG: very short patch repair endonuclease [Betaproteobacteria bacterium]|nr:very short patch repair endonuclease [Betaproteobacteria bacterium]